MVLKVVSFSFRLLFVQGNKISESVLLLKLLLRLRGLILE
jgi:hypothetical protein